jgi:hypothetical protein
MIRVRLALTAVVLMCLSLLSPTAAQAREEMSLEQAAETYLAQVCRQNRAAERFDRAMFGSRNEVTAKQMRGDRLRRTKRAAIDAGAVMYESARKLANVPSDWPAAVATMVARHINNDLVVSDRFEDLGAAGGAQQVFRRYNRVVAAWNRGAELSKRIRLELNLPRNGC